MSGTPSLADAFRARMGARAPRPDTLVAAVSGGRDSMVLLHLLRFAAPESGPRVVVAHLDHGMRAESAADARWVAGVCRAWALPLVARRLASPPRSEAEARAARYAFLEEVRREEAAEWVLTAHHADDQAETVLFRVLRGTGIAGLRGILEERPGVWRPLLGHRTEEIEAYARDAGLAWREDPTNRLPLARNVLRHEVLPRVREAVTGDPVGALVRLAAHAQADEAAWSALLPGLLDPLDVRVEEGCVSWSEAGMSAHPPEVRARLLRALARRLGRPLSGTGTRVATEVTMGRARAPADLGGGLRLRSERGRASLEVVSDEGPDRPLRIGVPGTGQGRVRLGGRAFRVAWSGTGLEDGEPLAVAPDRFPLVVRGWIAGDRIRLPYGTKKIKKLFLEARVPRPRRRRVPLVADRFGRILWVRGLARSVEAEGGEPIVHIRIVDAEDD